MKLTTAAVARLVPPEGKDEAFVWDDDLPAFGLRLRASGKRTWVVQYRLGTKQRRVSFGTPATHNAEEARRTARELLAKVRLGQDPQAERRKARAEAGLTFKSAIDRYIAEHVVRRQRPRSQAETRRHLEKHARPLHELPLAQVDRRLISDLVGRLVQTSGPIAANRVQSSLAALFGWALRQGLTETNPTLGAVRPALERSRERVLSLIELAEVWRVCGTDDFGRIVRLLILTGQRREEVAGLRWGEIDLDKAVWSLPGTRTKNGRPHDIPLSGLALATIRAVPRRAGRDLLFGVAAGGFKGWGRAKERLEERILESRRQRAAAAGIDPALLAAPVRWVLHDLRRSVVTHMNETGVAPHVVEAVVNHVSGAAKAGVAGTYNRSVYAAEKRQALERWADLISEIVDGGPRAASPPT